MKKYDEKAIKVLDPISHIRLNAGMYIGETSNPVHLIEEALDNSLDECLAGYAKKVAVNIDTKENVYTVMDDGRGIPIHNNVPEIVSTELFSGAKFKDSKDAYTICSGLHGVGLVAINALSEQYTVEIYRDQKHAIFEFENSKLKNRKIEDYNGRQPFSTKIAFRPDRTVFEKLMPDVDRIRRRLLVASVELSEVTFVLAVDNKKEVIKLSLEDFFKNYCMSENDQLIVPLVSLSAKKGIESLRVSFSYSSTGPSPKILSSVNLLPVEGGGTHVTCFLDVLKTAFSSRGKKLNLKFQPNDCVAGLRCYISLELEKPEFVGQTKDRLVNSPTHLEDLFKKISQELENYLSEHQDQVEALLNFFEDYRSRLDLRKLKISGRTTSRAATKLTKLRDCSSRNGELFIVEGDSAESTLLQCRDPKRHAILPLRGKIASAVNVKDILENTEVKEIITALGIGVYPNINMSNLRYDKVIIMTDADPDGGHIACLVIMNLAILVPDLVKAGKVYVCQTPLYAISDPKKKIFIPLWSEEELKKAVQEGKPILRAKGLGELNPDQLEECAIGPRRRLIKVSYTKDINKLIKLFSTAIAKRELLEGKFDI